MDAQRFAMTLELQDGYEFQVDFHQGNLPPRSSTSRRRSDRGMDRTPRGCSRPRSPIV